MKTDHVIALVDRLRDSAYKFIIREINRRTITGLSPSHGGILSYLFEREKASMKEIAERIGRDKSTVTALVKKLMATGYVLKETDSSDSRVTQIRLTTRGKSLRPHFDEISTMLISRAFRGFNPDEREKMIILVEKMLNNFSEK